MSVNTQLKNVVYLNALYQCSNIMKNKLDNLTLHLK